jgi:hypothetical protein
MAIAAHAQYSRVAHGRRLLAVGLCLPAAALTIVSAYVWLSIHAPEDRASDFSGGYVAATLWRKGHTASIYDPQRFAAAFHATGASPTKQYIPFNYPPAEILVAAPLTFTDGGTAYRVWSLLQLVLVAMAVTITARSVRWRREAWPGIRTVSVIALGSAGAAFLFIFGQMDGVPVLALAGAYALWQRNRRALGGFALGLGIGLFKPHLMLGILAFLVGRREWRALGWSAFGLAVVGAASLLVIGPGQVVNAITLLGALKTAGVTVGIPGLATYWLGSGAVGESAALVGDAGALATAFVLGAKSRGDDERADVYLAASVLLSVLVAPHVLQHDLTMLVPPFMWMVARMSRQWDARRSQRMTALMLTAWVTLSMLQLLVWEQAQSSVLALTVPLALVLIAGAAASLLLWPRDHAAIAWHRLRAMETANR